MEYGPAVASEHGKKMLGNETPLLWISGEDTLLRYKCHACGNVCEHVCASMNITVVHELLMRERWH